MKKEIYKFTCEVCGKDFEIKEKNFEEYKKYGIDKEIIEGWKMGFGAPICLDCLKKEMSVKESNRGFDLYREFLRRINGKEKLGEIIKELEKFSKEKELSPEQVSGLVKYTFGGDGFGSLLLGIYLRKALRGLN